MIINFISLFVQKEQKHNMAITFSGEDSETTMVLNSKHCPKYIQGGPKKGNHYRESSLNRFKNRQSG